MPTTVFTKLQIAFDPRCKRLTDDCLREKMVKVLVQVTGDLRLRSQQLNMIPLLWSLFLLSSGLSTAARDSLHAAGMTVTRATVISYLEVVGRAYDSLIRHVRVSVLVNHQFHSAPTSFPSTGRD